MSPSNLETTCYVNMQCNRKKSKYRMKGKLGDMRKNLFHVT